MNNTTGIERLALEKREVEERLRTATRARKVMAECIRVQTRASDEAPMLHDMCRIVVGSGGYQLAWIGMVEHDPEETIRPAASAGDDSRFLESVRISWADNEVGQSPPGLAVRSRTPQAARNIQTDPSLPTWLSEVVARGYHSAAALPLICGDEVVGILGILAAEPGAFDADELALLEELAHDISYGLSNLRLRVEQRRAEQLLRLEHTVTRCLAEAESVADTTKTVMRAVCETQGWDCGRYFRVDEMARVMRFEEAWGVPSAGIEMFIERSRPLTYAAGAGLVGRTWQSGEPLWIADIRQDQRAVRAAYTAESGIRGVFLFPVTSEGKTIGLLNFSSREIREPDERLLQAARVIGSQIGQFLQRKQAEAVLRESEARFRSLTTLSSDWYWQQDQEYRFVDMTSETDRFAGVSSLAPIGKRRWEVAAPNMTEADWTAHRAVLEAHQPFHDLQLCRHAADGKFDWISISGEPMFDTAGRFQGYRGIGKDITARKREERLLALEHAVTRNLAEADSAPTGLRAVMRAICESEGWECSRYLQVDETAGVMRFSEYWCGPDPTVEQFIAGKREAVYRPGDGLAGRVWQSGQPLWSADTTTDERGFGSAVNLATGMRGAFVFPVTAEGRMIGVLTFNSREVRAPDERLLRAVHAIGSQIGQFLQRKQGEQGLRRSEERFRSLTHLSSDVYWEQDDEYRFTSFSGTGSEETNDASLRWIGKKRWEQNYLNMSAAEWAAHVAMLDARKPFHDLELCRLNEAGERLWISVSGEPVFDASAAFKGYRGVGKEITGRKREEKLLAMEHGVTRVLAETATTDEAMQRILQTVCENLGWACGAHWQWDGPAELLRVAETWHIDAPGVADFVAASRDSVNEAPAWHGQAPGAQTGGLVRTVWQSGAPVWFPDVTQRADFRRGPVAIKADLHCAFGFPILAGERPLGVMEFYSSDIQEPDEALLQIVRAVGSQIGQFVQRKHSEETVRDQALRQRLIAEFGQQALASADVAEVLNRAAELVLDTLKVDFSNILQLAADERSLTYKAAVGWPREWVGSRVVPVVPGSRLERILSRKEPLIIEDYGAETGFSASRLLALGVHSGVQVPIFGPKGPFGVLSVHTRRVRGFSDEDVSFLRSVANILAIAIERKNAEDKLAHLAQFDTVTSLPNRPLFRDRLGQALSQAQRNEWLGGVLFVDLDRFKAVNDTYGHGVGDLLLREVATRLSDCVRTGDTVARLSGDEFAVVLSNLAKADDAALVSQKVIDALTRAFELDGHQIYVSASIGIAVYPADGNDTDTLVKNADTAMYRAKEEGRNCYRFYLSEMNERLMERMRVESRLRGALERGEYRLHYQPKVRLDTGVISGFEALLRWEQEGKLVAPLEFISILEDTGLIVSVGEWVLRTVCEQLNAWKQQGIAPRPVAVNLSPRQFQHKYLVIMVEQILRETGVAPHLLEFELTETLLMSDAEEAVQMLRELKGLGVRLAVDDFGTGYSSLAYLRRFPLDTLKIDRTFIRDAVSNPDDATLTLAIINLAHSMRLRVVAEGVETEGQLNFLRLHGCDEMQGYYFARPLAAEACTRMLVEDRRLQISEVKPADGLPALLLVDDDEDDLALMKRVFAADGFRILTANCAAAGFEALARHGAAVVISDYYMPGMGGIEFLTHVRKLYPDAVRVVTTGSNDTPTLSGAINKAGIHKFLSKAWDPGRLRAEVHEAYRQRVV